MRSRFIALFFLAAGSLMSTAGIQDLNAQSPVHNCDVYGGYLSGDMNSWTRGIAGQEQKYKRSGSSDDLYVLILSQYGYIGYLINLQRNTEVKELISSAEANIAVLAKDRRYAAPASALGGAIIAMKISLSPLKATYLGMRSLRLIEESLKIDTNDPTGWVEMGNARYHMPAVVGGSYKESARCFSEAVRLFEANRSALSCNWHYLHAMVWLAKSYEGLEQLDKAKEVYERLLKIEPEFQWVKRELYPDIQKKMGSLAAPFSGTHVISNQKVHLGLTSPQLT